VITHLRVAFGVIAGIVASRLALSDDAPWWMSLAVVVAVSIPVAVALGHLVERMGLEKAE
jgi:membrane protein implicated in regulation of membrane protease activity